MINAVSLSIFKCQEIIRRNLRYRKRVHCESQIISTPIICCVSEPLNIPLRPVNTDFRTLHFEV